MHHTDSITVEIAEQVAALEDENVEELTPIHDAVDTGALERLAEDPVRIEFNYEGYRIIVEHGDVSVQQETD